MDWIENLKSIYPFYEKGKVVLFNADSREVLPKIPERTFDLILTDPPYGINYKFYDSSSEIFFELEEEMYRITKDNAFLIFWWSTKKIPEISRLKLFSYLHLIIAEFYGTRSKTVVGDRKYAPICVYSKGKPQVVKRYSDVIPTGELPIVEGKILSGDFKPTLTLMQLLAMFSTESSLVLDPFAGYGSLSLTCYYWNRPCIAIEKDEIRFEVAKRILQKGKIDTPIPEMEKEVERGISRKAEFLW